MFVPFVTEMTPNGGKQNDLFSRLLEDRIILAFGEVNDEMAISVQAQLLFLAKEDPKKDIFLYINSPGGYCTSGMAIADTMRYIEPDVVTVSCGLSASMGAFLLSCGAKGKRFALPNSEIMIHQPSGGAVGQITDMEIHLKHSKRLKERLTAQLAENCGVPYETMYDLCERDNFMYPEEALDLGIIDGIMVSPTKVKRKKSKNKPVKKEEPKVVKEEKKEEVKKTEKEDDDVVVKEITLDELSDDQLADLVKLLLAEADEEDEYEEEGFDFFD